MSGVFGLIDCKNTLTIIESKLDLCIKNQDIIIGILDNNVVDNVEKMGRHISFVETVYNRVRTPLQYVLDRMNYFFNLNQERQILPQRNRNLEGKRHIDTKTEIESDTETDTSSESESTESDSEISCESDSDSDSEYESMPRADDANN